MTIDTAAIRAGIETSGRAWTAPAVALALCDEVDRLRAENDRLHGPFRCCAHCPDDPEYHAENPPNSHDTDCPSCGGETQRKLDSARAALEKVRALHSTPLGEWCDTCGTDGRCPTWLALEGKDTMGLLARQRAAHPERYASGRADPLDLGTPSFNRVVHIDVEEDD